MRRWIDALLVIGRPFLARSFGSYSKRRFCLLKKFDVDGGDAIISLGDIAAVEGITLPLVRVFVGMTFVDD